MPGKRAKRASSAFTTPVGVVSEAPSQPEGLGLFLFEWEGDIYNPSSLITVAALSIHLAP
jgi:hypothetical protein